MKKLLILPLITLVLCLFSNPSETAAQNQSDTMDDVKLFQSFFRDAPISSVPYGEGFLLYQDSDVFDVLTFGARAALPITPEIELGTQLAFSSVSGPNDFSESGFKDVPIYGRYLFMNEQKTKISGGAFLTLPIGEEEIFEGNFDFGFFGAVRHAVSDGVVLTGTLGLSFLEFGDDRESSLNLGAGVIYAATNELNLVGELSFETEIDYAALSAGVDYAITNAGRLRGGLLIGLDDGAPDFGLTGSFLLFF